MQPSVNPDKGFSVNGKSYTLRFSIRAMAALQEHYGLGSLEEVGHRLQQAKTISVEDLTAIVWAGLQTHQRGITMEETLDLVDAIGLTKVQELVNTGFAAAAAPSNSARSGSRPRKPGLSTG